MSTCSLKYHTCIAEYFSGKPLYLDESTSSKPNTRKLVEQPWQQTNAAIFDYETDSWDEVISTLCDLYFIEAKCAAGMTFDLIVDYHNSLNNIPENQSKVKEEKQQKDRVDRWIREIIEYSRKWSELRDRKKHPIKWFLNKILYASHQQNPQFPASPPLCRMWTQEEIEEECQRIIENPTRLDRLSAFKGFVSSQYYFLIEYGKRKAFILQHAFNFEPSGFVHDAATIILAVQEQYIVRRWPIELCPNPMPALLMTLKNSNPPTGEPSYVRSISVTPDGGCAVTANDDKTIRVWNLESGQCIQILKGHTGTITCVSVTPDGIRAVSGSGDFMNDYRGFENKKADITLRVWDLESAQCLKILTGHTLEISCVSITPDGRCAISGSKDNTIRVWDLERGLCLWILQGHNDEVESISISPDGRRAVSVSKDKTLRIWNLESGECLLIETKLKDKSVASMISNGRCVVSSADSMKVLDIESGQCLKTFSGFYHENGSICMTVNGKFAVTSHPGLRVWDLESGKCVRELEGRWPGNLSISVDMRRAVSAVGYIQVWNLECGQSRNMEGHLKSIKHVSITPNGRFAVSTEDNGDHKPRVWDLEHGQCLRKLEGHSGFIYRVGNKINCVSMTPDSLRAITGAGNHILHVWDLETGACILNLEGHRGAIKSVSVTPDGKRIVSASEDKTLIVWNLESGQCLLTLEGHTKTVSCVSITSDSRHTVSGSDDGTIRLWDMESGQCLWISEGLNLGVTSTSITSDGRHIVSVNWDQLRVWNLESGQCLWTMKDFQHWDGYSDSVSVTPDGQYVVTGGFRMRMWDIESGRCFRTFANHSFVHSLSISSDGLHAITGSQDGVLRAWHLDSGTCVAIYPHLGGLNSFAISPFFPLVVCWSGGEVIILEIHGISGW
jgi:WD40 repeat protein